MVFFLSVPPSRKLELVFSARGSPMCGKGLGLSAYGFPTKSKKKRRTVSKKTSITLTAVIVSFSNRVLRRDQFGGLENTIFNGISQPQIWAGLFYLRVSLFYLRLVFVAYGQLAWSFLLTVEIGFVFLLTVENRLGLFYLRFPPVRKLGLVFFAYGSPGPEIGFGLF